MIRAKLANVLPGGPVQSLKVRPDQALIRKQAERKILMSIFGKIAAAIFGGAANASPLEPGKPAATGAPSTPAPGGAVAGGAPAAGAPAAKISNVDVADVLDNIDADEDLDWRKSIVDLMKLLKLDSGLKARKELATELKYTGDMGDSASMNIWLHKQVMTKLAENGGVVPKELLKH